MNITKYSGKRGTTWQVKVRRQGRNEQASFKTKKEAEDWGRNLENSIVRTKYFPDEPPPPTIHTVSELIDIYIERIVNHHTERTRTEYLHCLTYWRNVLGNSNVSLVNPALLADCQSYLRNVRHLDSQTVNKYCRAISPAFSLAAGPTLRWITKNPFAEVTKLKEPKGRAPQLSDQQIQTLLDWCDRSRSKHLGLFARLVLSTGARKQEALQLRWGQVDFKRHRITLHGKGKKTRTLPLPSGMVDILQDIYNDRFGEDAGLMNDPTGQCVFPSDSNPFTPTQNIHTAWKKAITKSGLTHAVEGTSLRPHDLRHSYSVNMITKGGVGIYELSKLLGHQGTRMTERYLHLETSHLTDRVEKMGESLPL